MTFFLIGLGLNENSLTLESFDILKKCKKIYIDTYTVDFPYSIEKLEQLINKKIIKLNREKLESENFLTEAKKQNIALLIYGSPLFATTHFTLLETCKTKKIKYQILYNASVFDALGETGLQLYKFGKITSLPAWQKNYKPDSFVNIIKENQKIQAHSLILVDIGLEFQDAVSQLKESLEKNKIKLQKIIICENLGTEKNKIHYININQNTNKLKINPPYCIIIPSNLNFREKEFLENL